MPRYSTEFKRHLPGAHKALRGWYAKHGRHALPWREGATPYQVYISEIMLQQTQVKTVLERYYFQFLKRFPTLKALADAPVGDVLKAWEGLGYYTRARNLHKAAQQCAGKLPASVEGLQALPGIGRNTAHAVACFGFGLDVPIMEANVRRVLCRVLAMEQADDAKLWEAAEALLDRKQAFNHNQAMMDIGAMVCTRRAPRCGECPLVVICAGKDSPEAYPAPKAKKVEKIRKEAILVLQDDEGRALLMQRTTRFLGGLYGFPSAAVGEKIEALGQEFDVKNAPLLGQVRQVYSHFTLEAKVYLVQWKGKKPKAVEGTTWAGIAAQKKLPLSRADQKVAVLIENN